MTWWVVLSGGMTLLLALMFLGVPIFVSFLILNVIGMLVLIGPAGFGMFANSMYTVATLADLAAVPLFILMGELLFRSGTMNILLDSLDRLVGGVRGRQFILCILLSAICGALAGAAMAVAGLLGRSLYPTMVNRGYDMRMSAGTILGGASLDAIIPPSVLAIIIAHLAKVSTGKMLIAGILPGLLLTALFLIYVVVSVRLSPGLSPDVRGELKDPATRGPAWLAIVRMLPVTLIFGLVVGLIMAGVATPTESAATGVAGAALLAWWNGGLNLVMLRQAISSGVTVAGIMLAVMACATMFSQLLIFSGVMNALGDFIMGLEFPAYAMLFTMLAIPFVLFMFLDQVSVLMVLIPIYQPILGLYDFDVIWFWTLILVVATVGGITPPFGYTLYAFKSAVPDIPTVELFRAAWPFVSIILCGILLMSLFPDMVVFLPNLARG
mgnify:CR=1 FL=1